MSETAGRFNLLGIVGIVGALLMVIGVFLNWMELSYSYDLPIIGTGSETYGYTGMDVFGKDIVSVGGESLRFADMTSYYYAPVVALACGVVALIASFLPVFLRGGISKLLGALALVLAVVAIVVSFLYYSDISGYAFSESALGITVSLSVGAGLWMVIVGAAVTVIGGILDIAKTYR